MNATETVENRDSRYVNALSAGLAAGYLASPTIGIVCAVAAPILSSLADRNDQEWLAAGKKTEREIQSAWKLHGLYFIKIQFFIGAMFKLTGSKFNQAAIIWIRQNLVNPWKTLQCFFRVGIVAPLVEETLFRGFLQEKIHDVQTLTIGAKAAASKIHTLIRVALQAILFGCAHFHPVQGLLNVVIVLQTAAIGFYFGRLKEESGTIWRPMSFHNLINTVITTRVWMFGT